MKINNIKTICAAMLTLALAACQEDKLVEIDSNTSNTLRATMNGWGEESRAQVVLGNQETAQEIFMWNSTDAFDLIDVTEGTTSRYEIVGYNEDNPSATAEFMGKGTPAAGNEVVAVYPQGAAADGKVALSVEQNSKATDNSNDNVRSYMSKNMVMVAKGTVGSTQTNLQFTQLCAMVRVSVANAMADSLKVSNVTITSPGAFGLEGEYDIAAGALNLAGTAADVMTHEYSSMGIGAANTADFYFLAMPGSSIGDFEITVNDQSVTVPASEFAAAGIDKLESGKRYWFQLIQTNNGLIRKATVGEGIITNIPLIEAIEASYSNLEFVRDSNGFVNVEENQEAIDEIRSLYLNNFSNLTDLSGIEYFTNLSSLNITKAPLQTVDLSANKNLSAITLYETELRSINLEGLTNVKQLIITGSPLQTIDISTLTSLLVLDVGDNNLTGIDLSNNTKLFSLSCIGPQNKIKKLDLTNNLELETLQVGSNWSAFPSPLADIKFGNKESILSIGIFCCPQLAPILPGDFPNLEGFSIWCCNQYTEVDLSNNEKLKILFLDSTDITSLDLSKNPALEILGLEQGKMNEVELQHNTELKSISFNNSQISSIDLSNNPKIEYLSCLNSQLTSLDISNLTNLQRLVCYRCYLTELDITKNAKLEYIECGDQRDPDNNAWDAWRELTLTLTAAQEQMWIGQETYGNHVTLNVVEE